MITYEEAFAIATDYLKPDGTKYSHEFVIIEKATIQKPYGWIFFYQTKRYLETRQFTDAAVGNEPFIVEISTGKVTYLRGRPNIDFPFNGNYDELLDLKIAFEDQIRETE